MRADRLYTDPDNYTDEYTFLDHLQLNPRNQRYEFWRLVGDSAVIVQHMSSVIIFVCCFTGIFQNRISPYTVVGWGSLTTLLGWIVWDFWVSQQEEMERLEAEESPEFVQTDDDSVSPGSPLVLGSMTNSDVLASTISLSSNGPGASKNDLSRTHSRSNSGANMAKLGSVTPISDLVNGHPTGAPTFAIPPYGAGASGLSPKTRRRLSTLKSALLIYCAVLGLSPILKSLTKSTSKDSIWAMSAWLMIINVCFFDYSGGVGAKCVGEQCLFDCSRC